MTVSGLKQTIGERVELMTIFNSVMYHRLYELGRLDCDLTSKRMDIAAKHNTRVGDKSIPLDH